MTQESTFPGFPPFWCVRLMALTQCRTRSVTNKYVFECVVLDEDTKTKTCDRRCTGNGSSLRVSPPVSVYLCRLHLLLVQQRLTKAAALYFVGGIRTTFSIGVGAGGPAAYW